MIVKFFVAPRDATSTSCKPIRERGSPSHSERRRGGVWICGAYSQYVTVAPQHSGGEENKTQRIGQARGEDFQHIPCSSQMHDSVP